MGPTPGRSQSHFENRGQNRPAHGEEPKAAAIGYWVVSQTSPTLVTQH
jgi:hypothetical protein